MSFLPLHVRDLVTYMFNELDEEDLQLFTATVYLIWKRRNSFIFENKFEAPSAISLSARKVAMEYKEINSLPAPGIGKGTNAPQVWSVPPPSMYKINWDAAVDVSNRRVGIGAVVRDWSGQLIVAMMYRRKLFPDAFLAESFAALEATSLGINLGLRSIILEGDALNVVKGLNGESNYWNYPGLLIEDTRNMLGFFDVWSVVHVPRCINVVAHTLAKEALKLSEERIVLEEPPPCIHHLLS